ncbi:MAG: hypothetical protein JXB03_03785 [Spirochaetales bacterium]|nr:hypothetical protein [Spirochaetales bacterium]
MKRSKRIGTAVFLLTVISTFILMSRYNYLLFHVFAEGYSILIALAMFLIAWNAREITSDTRLVFLGIAYAFIAVLDAFHTLAYTGMNIFPDEKFYANQTWIAARFMEAASLWAYTFVYRRKAPSRNYVPIILVYTGLTLIVVYSIFIAGIFPVCFVAGQGQTEFKIFSEYIIILVLIIVAVHLYRRRKSFTSPYIHRLLTASVVVTAFSEAFFTLYIDNFGITNLIGHLLKILSFYFLYKAIIETSIRTPYQTIFAELNDTNHQKDRLISVLGHDLTNSLSGIHSNLELLNRPNISFSEDERREMFRMLKESSAHTLELLGNILSWARSLQGLLEMEETEIDIDSLIEDTLDGLSPALDRKEIRVRHTPHERIINGDSHMLSAIIRNILTNSIKYTPRGGEIFIECRAAEKDLELHIRDTGIGMDKETRDSLFTVGTVKRRKGTEEEKGSGFGLLLVDEFVKRHGGSIEVISAPGEGSEFVIRLPENPPVA